MRRPQWAVMISGRGSNLAALLELREEIDLRLVVSSNGDAPGLLRAKRAGVRTALTPQILRSKRIDWEKTHELLIANGITHIFLAGFMKIVPAQFVEKWQGRILNLHPSLLPAYPGLHSIERAHADGAAIGLTVHEVNEEVDAGQIFCQRTTLTKDKVKMHALDAAEFLVHVDEQRVVKEAVLRWKQDLRIS